MRYRIEIEARARRELLSLPREVVQQLAQAIDELQQYPRPPGSKKLVAKDGYRIRRAAYRVLYTVDDRERVVRVYRVGHRREIYRT